MYGEKENSTSSRKKRSEYPGSNSYRPLLFTPTFLMSPAEIRALRTPCEIHTRVMGYFRPVSHFNQGKKSEFYSRKYFKSGNAEFVAEFASCGCK